MTEPFPSMQWTTVPDLRLLNVSKASPHRCAEIKTVLALRLLLACGAAVQVSLLWHCRELSVVISREVSALCSTDSTIAWRRKCQYGHRSEYLFALASATTIIKTHRWSWHKLMIDFDSGNLSVISTPRSNVDQAAEIFYAAVSGDHLAIWRHPHRQGHWTLVPSWNFGIDQLSLVKQTLFYKQHHGTSSTTSMGKVCQQTPTRGFHPSGKRPVSVWVFFPYNADIDITDIVVNSKWT